MEFSFITTLLYSMALLVSSIQGSSLFNSSLVSIEEVDEFPFPHVVVIRYDGSPICGGGLLTSKAVLTSSQCCERIKSVSKTKVIAGALTLSDSKDEEAEVRDVIKIGEHPSRINQNNSWINDFCYLILKEDFAPRPWVSPKEIESNETLPLLMENQCFLTGWSGQDTKLSSINVTITDSKLCEQRFGAEKFMASDINMVCAETTEEADQEYQQWLMVKTIVCNGKIAGVLMDTDGCSDCDNLKSSSTLIPFTRLAPFKIFIEDRIKDHDLDHTHHQMEAILISTFIPLILSQIIK